MKDENDFNAYLSRELKKLAPAIHSLKASEKFHIGIPDFFIWGYGRCLALEVKYVQTISKPKAKLLKHKFSGPQISYLSRMEMAGASAYGLVVLGPEDLMVPVGLSWLDSDWSVEEFRVLQCSSRKTFHVKDVPLMVHKLLGTAYP